MAFARSIIAWNLELHDKKCRPTGAGVHDKALAHICPFPTHTPDCAANDTDAFLRFHAPRTDQVLPQSEQISALPSPPASQLGGDAAERARGKRFHS